MKLTYTLQECSRILVAATADFPLGIVTHVLYDSRKVQQPEGALFFCLNGSQRTGDQFISDAYGKGVRWFVIPDKIEAPELENAVFFRVTNPLIALQKLAAHHRMKFTYPVIGITGSVGKTTFKEWAFHVLSQSLRVVRSPKSFNSQLGAALSLLELHPDADVALIEAGISQPGEMDRLVKMIQPTLGVFTAFGTAHRSGFSSEDEQLQEKLKLFRHSVMTFVSAAIPMSANELAHIGGTQPVFTGTKPEWITKGMEPLLGLVEKLCVELGLSPDLIEKGIQTLPHLALRMEVLEGVNGNTIINDTYNLDADALREALHYQQQIAGEKPRVVILGMSGEAIKEKQVFEDIIAGFNVNRSVFLQNGDSINWEDFRNSIVLVKGSSNLAFGQQVNKGRELKHSTVVEIDLGAIRHNVNYFKTRLQSGTKILCMVKASSYGSGAEQVAGFLQRENVDYFGVAFADEGVALREAGITLPVIVMNPDPAHTELIVKNQLEAAVYSFTQMDEFVAELIRLGITGYPVHLKFDTGMHRLGFDPQEKEKVLSYVNSQPEITIRGLYSHLADADNPDRSQTMEQIRSFKEVKSFFEEHLQYTFLAHLLNSAGSLHFPEAQFDMIRLGIVLYGYTTPGLRSELLPAVRWKTTVSQVKNVPAGECVGYGCSEKLSEETAIAVIPVGYADGFRRSLGNGKGAVVIRGRRCVTVGRACMDMIMVNVTGMNVERGDEVEIIGGDQTMEDLAEAMGTIPYEVMTGLSKRMFRIYTEG